MKTPKDQMPTQSPRKGRKRKMGECKARQTKISKTTYNRKVGKYAHAFSKAFTDLTQFVETNCKGGIKRREAALDALCEIVDRYILLNVEAMEWCLAKGIDQGEFFCDVTNKEPIKTRKNGQNQKEDDNG